MFKGSGLIGYQEESLSYQDPEMSCENQTSGAHTHTPCHLLLTRTEAKPRQMASALSSRAWSTDGDEDQMQQLAPRGACFQGKPQKWGGRDGGRQVVKDEKGKEWGQEHTVGITISGRR